MRKYRRLKLSYAEKALQERRNSNFRRLRQMSFVMLASLLGLIQPAFASPKVDNVAHGDVSITQNDKLTEITASNNAIINYHSFDIARDETVRFIQPSESSRVLNRVRSEDPSTIAGKLLANGQVYIVNQAGIYFTDGALVDVGALYAVAGDMLDHEFLAGQDHFSDVAGKVVNDGTIMAETVALVGKYVANNGEIISQDGLITLAVGDDVYLSRVGSHVMVKVSDLSEADSDITQGIDNNGSISAGTGSASLVSSDMVGMAMGITSSGNIKAADVTIDSGSNGLTTVSGSIDASSEAGSGGSIKILGDKVALNNAQINANGKSAAGEILIGGDYQGKGEVRNASRTYISSDTDITANALESGNGGKVICWADEVTAFLGEISATGGSESGDGGFVEVSGKDTLLFRGDVDTSAASGNSGQLLLDPRDITITDGAAANDTEVDDYSVLFNDSGTFTNFTISEAKLESLAGGSNLTIQAERNLTIENLSDNTLNFAATAGNTVTLEADADADGGDFIMNDTNDTIQTAGGNIVVTTGSSQFTGGSFNSNGGNITLDADGSISVNQISTNGGNLTVDADENYVSGGDFTASGTIATNGGTADIDGVNININTLTSSGGNVTLTPEEIAITTSINTGAGNLTIYPRVSSHMDIGNGTTGLDISDAELGRITCSGILTLGDAVNTSSMDLDSITDHASISGTMRFYSDGDIEIVNASTPTITTPATQFYADDHMSINSTFTLGQDTIINCDADNDGTGTFYVDTTGDRLDTSAANANISITAANLDFGDESASRINAGSGNITLIASNNLSMGINTGIFNVTDAEMDRINTTGVLTFDTASTFTVNQTMTCEQNTAIIAGVGISQNNLITVTGNFSATTDVSGSNITLTNTGNDVSGTVSLNTVGAGDASWTENGNIDFAASSVGGALIIDSNGNDITDSGAVSVGASMAISDTDNVTLDMLAGDITFGVTNITTNLDVSVATGSITQNNSMTVGGTADFATTTANEDITLNNASNAITGQVTFATAGTTGNVVFDNNNTAINLGASTINGGLDIDTSGHLTVNGAVTTAGTTTLTADDITMTSTLNAGTSAITIAPDDNGTIGLGATAGNMTLSDAELDNITTSGTVTFDTNSSITIDSITPSNITGQFYVDSLATVSVVNGGSTFSGNFRAGCADIDITQAINCGANNAMISASNNKHIYLGTAGGNGNVDITGAELQNITAASTEFTTGNGENIYVNNVSAVDSATLGTVILDSAEDVIFQTNNSVFDTLTVEADDGLQINNGITLQTDTGAMSLDGNISAGAFEITTNGNVTLDSAGAITLNELTAGGDIDITAANMTINQAVNMGANDLTINTAGSVGIGATAGAMTIDSAEFDLIGSSTGDVTIISTGGGITVDNISAANSNGIGGLVTLQASGDNQNITFANNNSTFNTLTLNADDGIFINNVLVGTDVGNFVLTPDFDGGANDTNDKINFTGVNAGMITATNFSLGTINVNNALTLKANGSITFTADQTVQDGINIIADLDANGVGDFITNAGVKVDTSGNNGNINIAAADVDINGDILNGDGLNAGTGTITFVPQQATDVSLGTDSGSFGISAAELALMTADAIVIGDTAASFNSTSAQFNNVAIDGNFAAGAATVDIQTSGTVTISNGVTLSTTNENITINTDDLVMNGTGAINAGSGALAFNTESAGTDVVIGGTGQEFNIDDAELAYLTAGSTTITVLGDDDIYVSGVSDAAGEKLGAVTLTATGDNSTITFDTAAAQFDSLTANADSGITISQNITADTGNLVLEGDADNAADTNDNISISNGVNLTSSSGSVSLAATTGGIDAAGALTINAASGVTLSDTYTAAGAGALTVNADTDGVGGGTFTAGSTITIVDSLVSITAVDVALSGNVDSGSGGITILPSTAAGQTIVFGAAGGNMGFSAAEVGYLNTSGTLTLGNGNTTSLTVSTDPTNVTGAISLVATDTGGVIIVNGTLTPDQTLGMTALEGITVSSDITSAKTITIDADSDDLNNGTLTVDNGVTLSTNNYTILITAKDLALTGTGAIDSGTAVMSITESQAAGTVGLGGSAGTMQITDAELDNITNAGLTIYAPSDVTVNGVTADTGNTIGGTFLIDAAGKVTFATANSDFKKLEVQADDGVVVNGVTVSTDTSSIVIDGNADNSADASDTIAFTGVARLNSETTISLTATNDGLTTAGATTISAKDGITISDKMSLGGTTTIDADTDAGDNTGTFTFAAGNTLTTNNNALTISADDIDLAGSIAGGAGLLTIDVSDGGTIGLAGASGNLTLSSAELARITGQSGGMTVSGSDGAVTVNGMDVDTNITGAVTIDATNDNASVVFTGANSEFAGLVVNADDGIDISVDLSTTNGNMSLEGDADNAADTNDDIDLTGNRILTAVGGALTMNGTTGKLDGSGTLTLRGDDGITINDNLTTAGQLTIDADYDNDATGTLTVAGAVVSTNNQIDITADDISITGSMNAGTADMRIAPSTAIRIGLGAGAGDLLLSAAEINSLTLNDLYLGLGVATDLAVNTIATGGISGDITIAITGDMSIAGGQWDASANDSNFDIICNDMNLSADLNADTGSIRVRTSDGGGIGLGTAAQGMTLGNSDLVRFISSGGMTLETQAGEDIEVSGVTTGNTNNITGTLTLDADSNGSQVNFTNTASVLRNAVVVRADDGVDIDVNLTIENGSLGITGDTDGAADGRDYIAVANGVTVAANGGALTLTATTGNILADGALTLTSSGQVTINDDLTTNNGASTNLPLIINGTDFDFNGSAINADAGAITIRPSVVSDMGLGGTINGAFYFTDAELDKITTSGVLTFGGTNARDVLVDGFTAPAGVSGGVVFISGQNNGSVTFDSNGSSFQDALTIQALDGITINDNITAGGVVTINADTDGADNDGSLTLAAGISIDSTDNDINITADDISLAAGSALDAGTADMTITDSDGTGIGIGATSVANGVNITDTEFGYLTANNLEYITAGSITVDGITAANSNNIANRVTLDSGSDISFANTNSTFNELVAEADGVIQVNTNIVTDTDVLELYADTNGNAGGANTITFAAGKTLDSNTTITLDATSSGLVTDGSVTGAGALDIIADNGITFNNSISAGGTFTIDADDDVDGTGNLTIAAGASVNATGNDVDITANTVTFGAGVLTNVADLALSATINGDLTVNGDFDNSGSVTLESLNGTITINSAITSDESLTLTAKNGITINNDIEADADTDNAGGESIVINADSDGDGVGNLTVKTAGKSILANNNDITVTANDLDMQNDYAINAGTGKITINESQGTGIGIGDTQVATGLNVSTGELVRLTAAETEFVTSGDVQIDNVSAASSNNIGLLVIDNQGQSNFVNNASTFNALTVESDDGIDIGVNITTDTGAMSLDGDADVASDTNDDIAIAAGLTLQAETSLTLAAQTGKMTAAGTLSLLSESDITINDDLTVADDLTIDTDAIVVNNDGTGDLIVAADATVSTAAVNKQIDITANDIFLNGYLRAGTSTIGMTVSDNQDFALGDAAVENGSNNAFNINATEISHIYAGNLDLNTSGDVDISNILAGAADNITFMVTFNIDGHATISNSCVFNSITINANDGIDIGGNLTSQVGDIILEGDANNADDGNGFDDIRFAANSTITCANTLTLDATTGALSGSGSLVLSAAEGININDDLSTNGNLTINADNDLDGTGDLTSAPGKTYSCNNNDLDITGANVAFDSGITNVAGLYLTATTGDMNIVGAISFNNTGDLGLAVTNGTCLIDKVLSTLGAVTISASNGVDIRKNITGQGNVIINADNDADGVGDLSVLTGVQIVSNGGTIEITASDIDQLAGSLDSGIYVTKIDSTSTGIGIGTSTTSGMNLTNQELSNIVADTLEFVTSGNILIGGVQATSNNNIGTVILDAGGSIRFEGAGSTFNILDVQAENGIIVNSNVTTDTGEMFFNNDTSFKSGGGSGMQFGDGVTLTSALGLTLGGGGQLVGNGEVSLVADGDITILSDFDIARALNITTNNNSFNIDGVDVTVSADGPVNINSGDIDLTGSLNSLYGLITITPDSYTVGLGDGAGSFSLSSSELAAITSDVLLIDAAGKITASNVASDSTINIGTIELDSEADVLFSGAVIDSNLNVYASDGIGQVGSLTVAGDTTLLTNVDDKTIILDNTDNSLVGTVTIQTQSSGANTANVVLDNGGTALVLGDSVVKGDLTLTAGGLVSQSGVLTVDGDLTATTDQADSDIVLDNSDNSIAGTVAFYTETGGDVVFDNGINNIEIFEANIGGGMRLTAGGAVTDIGAVVTGSDTVIKTLDNGGADIILDNSGNVFGTLELYCRNSGDSADADGNIEIYESDDMTIESVATAGNLIMTAEGDIRENTAMTVDGTVSLKTLSDAGGDVILAGNNNFGQIDIDVRNLADDAFSSGNVEVRENGTLEIASIETTGGVSLTSDDIVLAGRLAGSQLAIRPLSDNTTIGVGDGAAGNMKLSTAEIASFAEGFGQITIGRSDASGKVTVEDVVFTDPIAIYSGGEVDIRGTVTGSDNSSVLVNGAGGLTVREDIITNGNDISLSGGFEFDGANIVSAGDVSGAVILDGDGVTNDGITVRGVDGITLNGSYTNNGGGEMLFDGSLTLADHTEIEADTADVSVTGVIDGLYDFDVVSDGGDIYFGGDMGTAEELANLTVITSGDGGIEFNSEINVAGDIYLSSGQELGIVPSEATIFKKNDGDLVFNAGGAFEVGANNRVTVSGGSLVITTGAGSVTLGDATVKENIIVNSVDATGDIVLLVRDKTESYVVNKNGTIKLLKDKGTAIAAEGYIVFNGTIVPEGEGSKPYFVAGNKKESDGLSGYKVYTVKEIDELIGEDEDGNEVIVVYVPVNENQQITVDPIAAALLRVREDVYLDEQIGTYMRYVSSDGIAIESEREEMDLAEAWGISSGRP